MVRATRTDSADEPIEVEATGSGRTVTVALKHPSGLHMDLRDTATVADAWGRKENMPAPGGAPPRRVTLHGSAWPVGAQTPPEYPIVGGFALTEVDEDFWNEWWERIGRHLDLAQRGLLFAHPRASSAAGEAREKRAERSGLEGLDPDKPGKDLERVRA